MNLSDVAHGRDNNFNAIRIIAACAVLVTHSFVLSTGAPASEPLRSSLGMTPGTIAVDVFFFTSGFLVSASLLARQNMLEFLLARVLRIFPGLLVMLLVTVYGLGLCFTTLQAAAYLHHPQTSNYFVRCLFLLPDVEYWLPGVFASNPYRHAVNGSLWTMPYELKMYAALAVAWVCLFAVGRRRTTVLTIVVVAITAVAAVLVALDHLAAANRGYFLRLYLMFFAGGGFFMLRTHVVLSSRAFVVLGAVVLLSALNRELFFFVYTALAGYLTLCIAYLPGGTLRKYNRLGDYSYGVYIYAFPVQQSFAALVPGISPPALLCASSITTLAAAAISWHLIEKPALAQKDRCARITRSLFRFGGSKPAADTLPSATAIDASDRAA